MPGLLTRSTALAILLVLALGCDSDDGSEPPDAAIEDAAVDASSDASGRMCLAPEQCESFRCECVDGALTNAYAECVGGTCGDDGTQGCEEACLDHGGIEMLAEDPNPHVGDSQECRDFCEVFEAQAAELPCGMGAVCHLSMCEIPADSCAEGTRAFLRCLAETAELMCYGSDTIVLASDCEYGPC